MPVQVSGGTRKRVFPLFSACHTNYTLRKLKKMSRPVLRAPNPRFFGKDCHAYLGVGSFGAFRLSSPANPGGMEPPESRRVSQALWEGRELPMMPTWWTGRINGPLFP